MADFLLMAKHKTVAANNLVLTWNRVASKHLWGSGLFWFSATIFGAATFLMDFLRTENGSWLWAITYTVSLAFVVGLVLLAKHFFLPALPDRALGAANLLIAIVVGGLKNLSVGIMAIALGLEAEVDLWFRYVGGGLMGVAIISVYAAITGSRSAHAQAIRRLVAIRSDLLGSKENLELLLAEELERLQEKSRETVLPKIEQISKLLKNATKTSELIEEIGDTVKNRVRPLMQEISQSAAAGLSVTTELAVTNEKVAMPKRFVARDLISPLAYLAYDIPAVAFLGYYFQGIDGVLAGTLATATFAGFMWLFKYLLFPRRATSRLVGFALLSLAGLLAPVVGLYLIGGLLPLDAHQSFLLPLICWIVYLVTVVVLAPVFLRDAESQKLEELIETENESLAKEIAIFEQKLWVFKKRWLFMLHGTVQSALTAALTRLQTFAESDPYQVSLVQADLERAERALQTLPANEIDFEQSSKDLKEAWAGVCAITIDVDLRASRALAGNQGSAYCVNEILKEAVGNAVRHGSATAVLAKITRDKDDFIDLVIQNDGTAPNKRAKKGIGSRMLDDITIKWSLGRSGKLTTLTARLPL